MKQEEKKCSETDYMYIFLHTSMCEEKQEVKIGFKLSRLRNRQNYNTTTRE